MYDDHAKKAREVIDVPWDEVRAARVHKKALEAFKLAEEAQLAEEAERELEDGALEGAPIQGGALEGAPIPGGTLDDAPIEDLGRPESGEAPEEDAIPMVGSPRRWLVAALAAAAIALALFGSGLLRRGADPGEGALAMTWQPASTLEYTDGSRSLLAERAEVQVVDDRNDRVEVEQRGGRVRYEIAERPERRFVVEARDVTVTVLGTVFEVNVAGDEVVVSVQRGRVRVEHGATEVELTRGQRIALTAPTTTAATEPATDRAEPAAEDASAEDAEGDEAEAIGAGGGETGPTAAELLRAADTARAAGRLDEAARRLRQLIAAHPKDGRVTLAMFTLGRVERARGQHDAAARAFESCGDALQGDAIAEAASSWLAAGQSDRASAAARRYLDTHPSGVHAEQMKRLAPGRIDTP